MSLTEPIPFIDLHAQQLRIRPQLDAAIARVLAHGAYILGPEVEELECRLAGYCGAQHTLACASGTDALLLALMAEGIRPGDAVFMPSFTFVATAEVVALLGATPVFVDIDEDDFLIDSTDLQRAIEASRGTGLRPKAVIPVDLFGLPVDYAAVAPVAEQHGLFVLADAAQSFGGARAGRRVGSLAPVTATSFFPAKPLGCYGDGGALFTDHPETVAIWRSLRVHGQGKDKYNNVRIGINGRLDTLQAAILIEKLKIFQDEIEARQRVAKRYNEGLSDLVRTPVIRAGVQSAWAQYTLRVADRDAVAAVLKGRGVPTAVYYPTPLHRQTAYREYPTSPGGLPVCERLAREVLSLPLHPYLDATTQDYIMQSVRDAVKAA